MIQWVTAISLSLGIALAELFHPSFSWMCAGLLLGMVGLFLLYKRIGSSLLTLFWNATIVGMLWYSMRVELSSESPDSQSFVEVIASHTSDYARTALGQTGLSKDNIDLLNALLLGNRKDMSYEQKTLFRAAGAQHLLALSGLHLSIFIGLLSYLYLRRIRFTRWRWPALCFTLLLLWGYCVVAGMPLSLMRAMLMTTLFYFGLYANSETYANINLANTITIMLLIVPQSLFDIGAQLSFVAVGALIWLYPVLISLVPQKRLSASFLGRKLLWVLRLFFVSLSAWLGTVPLCFFYFHQFQPWQSLVSVVLVPLTGLLLSVSLILLLLSLLKVWFLAIPLAKVVSLCIHVVNTVLGYAVSLPFSTIKIGPIHVGHVLLLYLLIITMGVGIHFPGKARWMAIPTMLLAIFFLCIV